MDKFMEAFIYVICGVCMLVMMYIVLLLILINAVITLSVIGGIVLATMLVWLVIK